MDFIPVVRAYCWKGFKHLKLHWHQSLWFMLKSEESQACRVKLIYFTQKKVNEWLNVCDTGDPTPKTDLETRGNCSFFFYGTCFVNTQYLNCTCNWKDWMILDGILFGVYLSISETKKWLPLDDLYSQHWISVLPPWNISKSFVSFSKAHNVLKNQGQKERELKQTLTMFSLKLLTFFPLFLALFGNWWA